jgi:peptidoglycan biosynthesis protein MviN/MurJ (putative lipid II flippase)
MFRLGIVGLPLSTSLVTLGCALWLVVRLRALVPDTGGGVATAFLRCAAAAALMGVVVWAAAHSGARQLASSGMGAKLQEVVLTMGGMVVGVAVYAGLAWLMRIGELADTVRALRRKAG